MQKPKFFTVPSLLFSRLLFSGIALTLLSACDQPLTYEKASLMEPYRSIADTKDRHWLFEFHQSRSGAAAWVEDEVRLLDKNITYIWYTDDGKLEFEDEESKKTYSIDRDKVYKMVQSKGGPAAARELVAKARKEIGGYATPPNPLYLMPGMSDEWLRAQKLTYPALFEQTVIAHTQKFIERGQQMAQAGNVAGGTASVASAIEQRKKHLGADHPATLQAAAFYQTATGQPYVPKNPQPPN